MDNKTIASKLCEIAKQLEKQNANLFRTRAYRSAAQLISALMRPVAEIVETRGIAGLCELPGIGEHIAFAIEKLVTTGEYHVLADRPSIKSNEDVRSLTGIGPRFAEALWEKYSIRTTAELEQALREERLKGLPIGKKRKDNWLTQLQARYQTITNNGLPNRQTLPHSTPTSKSVDDR